MAIPKVCGIENEFGFQVFDIDGKPINNESSDYREAAHRFVSDYLVKKNAIPYDFFRESRKSPFLSFFNIFRTREKEEELEEERNHRLRIKQLRKLFGSSDGFLDNGARFYLDDAHPEYSTPECLLPSDLAAYDKASELVILEALHLFQKQFGNKYKLRIRKNNSDRKWDHSYASHLNVSLSRKLVDSKENFQYLVSQYVPFQIARLVLIGGGKLGAENGRPECEFQISQRADFFEELLGIQTVERRPIFNTRNEPHADPEKYFRLHDISTDSLMCEYAIFLKAALAQVVLAMIEDKFLEENFMPKQPIWAMAQVSRDLKFDIKIELESGKEFTGLEILRYYLLKSKDYLSANPLSEEHSVAVNQGLALLDQLEKNPLLTFGKLDWTTTLGIIKSRPADALQNALNFREISDSGLYYEMVKRGKMRRLLTDERIAKAVNCAPADTRAYARSEIMKRFRHRVKKMSWGAVELYHKGRTQIIDLEHPALDKKEADMILSLIES